MWLDLEQDLATEFSQEVFEYEEGFRFFDLEQAKEYRRNRRAESPEKKAAENEAYRRENPEYFREKAREWKRKKSLTRVKRVKPPKEVKPKKPAQDTPTRRASRTAWQKAHDASVTPDRLCVTCASVLPRRRGRPSCVNCKQRTGQRKSLCVTEDRVVVVKDL